MYTIAHLKTTNTTTKQTIYRVSGFVNELNANADYYPFPDHPDYFGNPMYATSQEALDGHHDDKGYVLFFRGSDEAVISKGMTAIDIARAPYANYDKDTKFEDLVFTEYGSGAKLTLEKLVI
jgi:hypothetical protein